MFESATLSGGMILPRGTLACTAPTKGLAAGGAATKNIRRLRCARNSSGVNRVIKRPFFNEPATGCLGPANYHRFHRPTARADAASDDEFDADSEVPLSVRFLWISWGAFLDGWNVEPHASEPHSKQKQ